MDKNQIEELIDARLRLMLDRAKDSLAGEPQTLDVDWDEFPASYQWAAKDENGGLYVYTSRPSSNLRPGAWISATGFSRRVRAGRHGERVTNWEDTLVRRPEPVSKPVVDWSVIPVWCNWVAMTRYGVWEAYTSKPYIAKDNPHYWSLGEPDRYQYWSAVKLPPPLSPDPNGLDWTQTRCRRPS